MSSVPLATTRTTSQRPWPICRLRSPGDHPAARHRPERPPRRELRCLAARRRRGRAVDSRLSVPGVIARHAAAEYTVGHWRPSTRRSRRAGGGSLRLASARPQPGCGPTWYLAVRGGIVVPETLAGGAADLVSGLGPSPLRAGDVLPAGAALRAAAQRPTGHAVVRPADIGLAAQLRPGQSRCGSRSAAADLPVGGEQVGGGHRGEVRRAGVLAEIRDPNVP